MSRLSSKRGSNYQDPPQTICQPVDARRGQVSRLSRGAHLSHGFGIRHLLCCCQYLNGYSVHGNVSDEQDQYCVDPSKAVRKRNRTGWSVNNPGPNRASSLCSLSCECLQCQVHLVPNLSHWLTRTFLQIGRRSEEKGTAVWTLVALAVRLTMAMGLNQEPNEGVKSSEIFFHRQMRLRLWLTICLLDLQASFAQSTKPLISHIDAEAAVSQVRHLNDYDFDLSTTEDIPDREELTETTFALVTYRAQVAGRLLNFAAPEPSSSGTSGTSSPSIAALPSRKQRRHYVSQFQQQALVLLHFCDPESSSYAWFTWHSTQCLVSAMRLSELLPFQYTPGTQTPATPPSPRSRSDTDLLRRTLQNLEKAQLMYSDPRGERFRWYITIPWLALSTAIAECNICPDTDLVRRAWPVIEASYEQYESFFLKNSGDDFQSPLAVLMNQTRERLSSTLQGTFRPGYSPCGERGNDSVNKSLGQPLPTPNSRGSVTTPVDPVLTAGSSIPNGSSSGSEASYIMSTQLFPQHGWDPNSLSLEYTPGIGGSMTTPNLYHSLSSSELFEPSWIGGDVLTVYSNLETEDTSLVTSGDRQHRDLYEISNHTRI